MEGSLVCQQLLVMMVAHCSERRCKIPMDLTVKIDEIRHKRQRFLPRPHLPHSINDGHLVRFLVCRLGYHHHLIPPPYLPPPVLFLLIPIGEIEYVLIEGRLPYTFLVHIAADVLHRGHFTSRYSL